MAVASVGAGIGFSRISTGPVGSAWHPFVRLERPVRIEKAFLQNHKQVLKIGRCCGNLIEFF